MAVLGGPAASAAGTYTAYIRDLTPPVASVDQGGTVTFINQIQDKSTGVSVLGVVSATATVHTDVTLVLPSGTHTLASQPESDPNPENGSSVAEKFTQSCVTCTITYAYRVTFSAPVASNLVSQLTGQALQNLALPQSVPVTYNGQQITVTIGVPTPFVVNTLLPLPSLPSVNLPKLPSVTVPALPGTGTLIPQLGGGTTPPATAARPGIAGIGGAQYTYETGGAGPQLAPSRVAAGSAFDPSRLAVAGSGSGASGSDPGASTGSGGLAGGYDGASGPVSGQLGGVNGSSLADKSATRDASSAAPAQTLPAAALAAVIALAAVTAALVRTHQASRAHK